MIFLWCLNGSIDDDVRDGGRAEVCLRLVNFLIEVLCNDGA
jgi:hypothetical protein